MRAGVFLLAGALALGCEDDGELSAQQKAAVAQYVLDELPTGTQKLDFTFGGGKVTLLGVLVDPRGATHAPETPVKVSLFWRAEEKLEPGWLLFTHLVSAGGQVLVNLDDKGPLRTMVGYRGQPLPPSRWEPGKIYRDDLHFAIPADPSPQVTVAAGIYRGQERMEVSGKGADKERRAPAVRLNTGAPDARAVVPEVTVTRLPAGATATIDGVLDEPWWASAPKVGPFVDVGSGKPNPKLPTQGHALLAWDEAHLYVGFEVADRDVRGGWPADAKDPHLWEKDTTEVMLDPDGDGDNKDYYEIQVNPQGLVFDTRYDAYNSPNGAGKGPFGHEEWTAGLTAAVKVRGTMDQPGDADEGYTVEAKIPWASFEKAKRAPPASGDTWRMNFYAMQDNGGTAWSPILGMGNFHRASRFGKVTFRAPEAPVAASASASASASAGPAASAAPAGSSPRR